MFDRKFYFIFFSFIIFLTLASASKAFAQQPLLQKKISGTFTDVPLINALRKIATQNNLKFSYNPDIIQTNKRVRLRYNNLSIAEVLKKLINDSTVNYREIGNQIVLYRVGAPLPKVEVEQRISPDKVVPNSRKSPDTVFVYRLDTLILNRIDTVFRSITITRFDTIRLYDTVFRDKVKPQKPTPTNKNAFAKNSMKRKKYLRNNGFYSGAYLSWLPGSSKFGSTDTSNYNTRIQAAISPHLSSYEAGLLLGYDYYMIGVRTGVGITRFSEQFSYSFVDEKGGFFKKDTVEKYYLQPIGIDTTWIYIFDSTWIPKESVEYNYKNLNSYHYLSFPLSLKFRFVQNDAFDLYALAGINAQILLRSKALYILPDQNFKADWIPQNNLNPFQLGYHAGLGAMLKFSNAAGIFADAVYRGQINDQYSGLPSSKHIRMLDIKLGAYVKF